MCCNDCQDKLEHIRMAINKPFVEHSANMTDNELKALQKFARGTRGPAIAVDLDVSKSGVYHLIDRGLVKLSISLGREVHRTDLVHLYLDMIEEAAK